jgi:hypothetical protein
MHHGEHATKIVVRLDLQTVRYIQTGCFLARDFEVSCWIRRKRWVDGEKSQS